MNNKIDDAILIINNSICRHIDDTDRNPRDVISQDILSYLRRFVEHIMLKIASHNQKNVDISYENIKEAKSFIDGLAEYKFLSVFHKLLQTSVSHYISDPDGSERLMLKYHYYLNEIKLLMKDKYELDLLSNLEKFYNRIVDSKLDQHYSKIADAIEKCKKDTINKDYHTYYIHEIIPFSANKNSYYQITFTPSKDGYKKINRHIAFTKIPIQLNYACKMTFVQTNIEIEGYDISILVIVSWDIWIRKCEFDSFIKLIGCEEDIDYQDRKAFCSFMAKNQSNLLDIVTLAKSDYQKLKNSLIKEGVKKFFNTLEKCRDIILNKRSGQNVLRYLLYTMRYSIIINQYSDTKNKELSELYLKNDVIPFDCIPITYSLKKHTPQLDILRNCFDFDEHKFGFLARHIIDNAEYNYNLFTDARELDKNYENFTSLVKKYNKQIRRKHLSDYRLEIYKNYYIFRQKYIDDYRFIINKLKEFSEKKIDSINNNVLVNSWLNKKDNKIHCDEKEEIIRNIFINSSIALIYGASGTGKSSLINHLSNLFVNKKKLFVAVTSLTVNDLKEKTNTSNSEYKTMKNFLSEEKKEEYDILIVDECHAISNEEMKKLLEKFTMFNFLILVGDVFKIRSIKFGNWFKIVTEDKLYKESCWELTKLYRADNNSTLHELWKSIREMEGNPDNNVLELLIRCGYISDLDKSLFEPFEKDEIILCLNYDGFYGINNINKIMQSKNPSKPVLWGLHIFKINDPVLFSYSKRFGKAISRGMRGRILDVKISLDNIMRPRMITFDIELNTKLNKADAISEEYELLEEGTYKNSKNSVIRFNVYDSENCEHYPYEKRIIPIEIAYATSFHKAQGLEYDSVKIVIANVDDKIIRHDLFYTAVTRTKKLLKIYWSSGTDQKILSKISKKTENNKNKHLLIALDGEFAKNKFN